MGQTTSSCVAGTMGWQEPYVPAKIISDIVVDEYQLNNAVPTEQQNINRRLTSLLTLKCGCLDSNSVDANSHYASCQKSCQAKRKSFISKSDSFQYSKDYTWKKSLHKETYCKDVNLNSNQNDNLKQTSENIKLLPLPDELTSRAIDIRESKYNDLSRKTSSIPENLTKSSTQIHVSSLASNQLGRVKKASRNSDLDIIRKADNLNVNTIENTGSVHSLLFSRTPFPELLEMYCHKHQTRDNIMPSSTVQNCKEVLLLLTNHADNVATNFAAAIKAANGERWKSMHEIATSIHGTIQNLVQDYCVKGSLKHYASLSWQKVMSSSEELMAMLNSNNMSKDDIKNQITMLAQELHNVMESLVLYELLVIVEEIIDDGNNSYWAVTALIELATISDFMCCLIVKAGGIQALTNLLLQNQQDSVHLATLRALTILCNVRPALCHLNKHGIEHILHMLHLKHGSCVLKEALVLMAQLTDKRDTPVTSQILENSENITVLLNDIMDKTKDETLFLFASVVMANLSTMSAMVRKSIFKHSVLKTLVLACTEKTLAQLPATKEQVATILASISSFREETNLADISIIHLLLSFVKFGPTPQHNDLERAMCRRTQEKSAALLSLICNQKDIVNRLVNDKGLYQLLSICQNKEFAESKVLLFCTLVLQRIVDSCQDRHNLTKSLDQSSYLSQQESFV